MGNGKKGLMFAAMLALAPTGGRAQPAGSIVPAAIYGKDGRVDPPRSLAGLAGATVGLFEAAKVRIAPGSDRAVLATRNYGKEYGLCPEEPFRDQPTGPSCSGFLVTPEIVVTAGHCVRNTA